MENMRVHLCRDAVDFRKQRQGLSVLVQEELELDPFSAHLFAFCNRKRDHGRLLYWERNGFAMGQKRLEADKFPWPREACQEGVELSGRELNWLLDGLDVFAMKPPQAISYQSAF